MAYTTEEVQSAVTKLVQDSIRRPVDTLGVRRTDLTFTDVQEAAAATFVLNPLGPFYCVLLGSKRIRESLLAEVSVVAELRSMVGAIGRRVLPIESVESLFNAASALQQLEVAVSENAPKDITKLPAFQRFALNVQDFLLKEGAKVKDGGDIVPTPQEARSRVPLLVRDLTEQHTSLLTRVTSISNAMVDYGIVNLPALVARGVVSKARQVMSDHADELEAQKPEDRLTSLREVVLDLLAAKSVVQKFGSTGGQTIFVPMSGTGQPYSDALRFSTPASKTANNGAPYVLREGANQLKVTMDGGTEEILVLNNSLIAIMPAIRAETTTPGGTGFIIGDGTNPAVTGGPPNNNELKLSFTDITLVVTPVTVPLTLSALSGADAIPRTAQEICDDINVALTGAALGPKWNAEPYFFPATFQGILDITVVAGATADFTVPTNGGANLSFVKVGHLISILAGPNAGLWTVTVLNSATSIRAVKVSGVATTEALRSLEAGEPKRAIRIRAIQPSTQILAEAQVNIVGDSDKNKLGATTLGFSIFAQSFCRPTTAQQVADDITVKSPLRIVGSSIVSGVELAFRTEPGNPNLLVSSKKQTLGNITYTAGSPNAIDVAVPSGGLLDADILVGDVVVLRGGVPGGTSWTITAITDTTCHATSLQTAINGTGVSIEFGTSPNILRWRAIEITEGVLEGRYYVKSQGSSLLDVVLFNIVNANADPATRLPLSAVGTYGSELLVINSKKQTVASQVSVNDTSTAINQFFTTPTSPSFGTSPWFQLPTASVAVDTGDQLEMHASQYNEPSNIYKINSVTGRILGISPEIPSNQSWSFNDQPPPFARIRNGTNLNFAEYKELLDEWLLLGINQTQYFRDLNRFLNPLLQNATPTAEQVGTTLNHLDDMLEHLLFDDASAFDELDCLDKILDFYHVDVVPPVDTLIKSFVEKGADRAVDLLLAAQFSSFFLMSVHDSSYGGFMQQGMREVMQNDLTVRSTRRLESHQSRLRSTAESPDFEFSFRDVEDVGVPDIPYDFDDTPR